MILKFQQATVSVPDQRCSLKEFRDHMDLYHKGKTLDPLTKFCNIKLLSTLDVSQDWAVAKRH